MKSKLNSVLFPGGGKLFVSKLTFLLFVFFTSLVYLKSQSNSYCGSGYAAADNFFTFSPEGQEGIQIQYFKRGKMLSNICGNDFGYDVVVSVYNKFETPKNCNYSIIIRAFALIPNIIENSGMQNFSIIPITNGVEDYAFDFVGTILPGETKCGILKFSFPNTNYSSNVWLSNNHQFAVTNNATSNMYNSGANPSMFSSARRFIHHFDPINSSAITFDFQDRHFFHKDLTIDVNTNMHGYNGSAPYLDPLIVFFANESGIKVESGNLLDLYNVIAEGCDVWNGIEVESGATMNAELLSLSDANIGIKLLDNADGSVRSSILRGNYTGMMIEDYAVLSDFRDIEFSDSDIGVYLNHAHDVQLVSFIPEENSIFKRCNKGVFSWFSEDIEVIGNSFESIGNNSTTDFTRGGVVSVRSNLLLSGNDFSTSGIGISSYNDQLYDAARNNFSDNGLGIRIENNRNEMFISENTITGEKGVYNRFGRQPNFRDNHINNFDKGSGFSYGISSNMTTSPLLSLNYVYSSNSQGGAIFNKCNAAYVYNENYFSLLSQSERQSCIEFNGGMGNQVYNNHFDATTSSPFTEAFGLRASAGGVLSTFCNDFFQIEEAIVAEHGQTDVELKTNNLFDTRVGIKIDKSVLGVQTHHGNLFTGPFGDMALLGVDLLPIQINNSQFIVNGNVNSYHVPLSSQVSPAGLKDVQDNGTAPTCNSITYTTSPRDRLLALCDYINSIRNNTTLDPIRKKNLLAFYYRLLAKYFPEVNKPYCVNLFMAAFNNSNIEKMNVAEAKVDQLLEAQSISQTLKDNHTNALSAYLDAIKYNGDIATTRINYYSAANALEAAYSDRTAIDIQLIQDIAIALNAFIPEDSYDEAWLTLHSSLIKIYNEVKLDDNEISELQNVASLCPTDYGDVVYGARALLSDIDKTRYELTECQPDAPRIKGGTNKDVNSTTILPNPASNVIELNITAAQVTYSIVDVNGISLVENKPYFKNEKVDVSHLNNGVYFVVIRENGKQLSHKLIIME